MYARITRRSAPSADIEGRRRFTLERTIPAARGLDGVVGGLWLLDRERQVALSVTIWESEAAMRASEAPIAALRETLEEVASDGWVTPDEVETYEVIGSFFEPRA